MKNNKRGVSAIIATVLIIALTVGIIALIGPYLVNMVQDSLEGGTKCSTAALQIKIETEAGLNCYNATGWTRQVQTEGMDTETLDDDVFEEVTRPTIDVQVGYGSEDIGLKRLYIIPQVDGTDIARIEINGTGLPDVGLKKVITVNVTEKPDFVAVIPVISIGSNEKQCTSTPYVPIITCA
jgi:FlaG/FlaF family flagellin (archaellin)